MDKSEKYTETKSINGTTGSSVGKQLEIFFEGNDPEQGGDGKGAKEEKDIEEEEEKNNNELKKRKFSKSKLPKKATEILQGWFLLNISSPYPEYIFFKKSIMLFIFIVYIFNNFISFFSYKNSNETKNNLMKMTGLSKMQLENWFTNNRKVNYFYYFERMFI